MTFSFYFKNISSAFSLSNSLLQSLFLPLNFQMKIKKQAIWRILYKDLKWNNSWMDTRRNHLNIHPSLSLSLSLSLYLSISLYIYIYLYIVAYWLLTDPSIRDFSTCVDKQKQLTWVDNLKEKAFWNCIYMDSHWVTGCLVVSESCC